MNRATATDEGWCCYWRDRNCSLFTPCVTIDGAMMCVACAARDLDMPAGSTTEQVLAEAIRRMVAC